MEDLLADAQPPHSLADWPDGSGALIIYTSGTTGRPKGAPPGRALAMLQAAYLASAARMHIRIMPSVHARSACCFLRQHTTSVREAACR